MRIGSELVVKYFKFLAQHFLGGAVKAHGKPQALNNPRVNQ
jgi:hypothetical protein